MFIVCVNQTVMSLFLHGFNLMLCVKFQHSAQSRRKPSEQMAPA